MAISGSHIWAGPEVIGRRSPGTSPKVSLMTKGTCGAQSTKLILPKNVPWKLDPRLSCTGCLADIIQFEELSDCSIEKNNRHLKNSDMSQLYIIHNVI